MNTGITITSATAREKLADHRAYLELHSIVCRECDFITGTLDADEPAVYALHNDHFDQTGHNRFWKYTISRSNGRIGHRISDL
ncbi:hypothetical protein GCM10027176_51910 [Actinoallomurus bryophytorum]|uniref:Uncharacterized protein n=1 Tax=Actinoallomurus bryophytorum TaxID=1490222 RepID=A0A543CHJ4_9ACTN|nr:hypothetical protein [Actinoallomurus bryophytorum]TQL96572.1 hypothetical protein FB559_2111 [Actinoallomurus bryophytorum]